MPENKLFIIGLYVVGMALSVAEIFLPGAIAGILGAICLIGSIYLAFQADSTLGWVLMAITVASVPVFIVLWVKVLNRIFAMKFTQAGYSSARAGNKDFVGQEGVALTPLRPAGMVRIGEQKVDVVSEGEVIERDARVRVVEVHGNRIVVRAIKG